MNLKVGSVVLEFQVMESGEPPGELKITSGPPLSLMLSTDMLPTIAPLLWPPFTVILVAVTMSPAALTTSVGLPLS